jgi:serine/threonine-protein kinase
VLGTDPPAGRRTPRDSTVTLLVSRGPEFVAVPTVSGVPVATARDRLEDAGLTVGRTQQAFDEEVPAGRVIGSTPRPGARARSGTAVVLRVSQGPAPVEVPDLRGTGRRAATSRLSGLGLSGRVTGQAFDTSQNPVAAGAVLSQQPAPGVRLRKGGTVSLVISKGPPLVTVPDVVSRQLADAQAALQAQGFQVQVQEILGGYFNTVRRQEPAAGTRVPRGAVVTLVVV